MAAPHAPHKKQQATIELLVSLNKGPVLGRLIWRDNLSPNVGPDCIAIMSVGGGPRSLAKALEPLVQQIQPTVVCSFGYAANAALCPLWSKSDI